MRVEVDRVSSLVDFVINDVESSVSTTRELVCTLSAPDHFWE
jgi:hypothetical protein